MSCGRAACSRPVSHVCTSIVPGQMVRLVHLGVHRSYPSPRLVRCLKRSDPNLLALETVELGTCLAVRPFGRGDCPSGKPGSLWRIMPMLGSGRAATSAAGRRAGSRDLPPLTPPSASQTPSPPTAPRSSSPGRRGCRTPTPARPAPASRRAGSSSRGWRPPTPCPP